MDARTERQRSARRTAAALAVLVFVGYCGIARSVGNFYPFSTFPMYAGEHRTTGSRIVAKDGAGALHEITDATSWACDAAVLDPNACSSANVYSISYVDREALDYVRANTGDAPRAEPVEIVRHIWTFGDDGASPSTRDCSIAQCRAVLR